ncbi:MAG: PD-(D/E)XK nuclease family protein [Kiritimatiellia bacterium]
MAVTLHFAGRKRSALEMAAEFLVRDWKTGPIDLRDDLVIVPTRNAGRRLRERLALLAAEHGTAVLPGVVETPSRLFAPGKNIALPAASDVIAEAFWRKTLDAFDPRKLEPLSRSSLAENPAARSAAAEHLVRLRAMLCEEHFDLTSFASQTAEEKERWSCLAELETAYRNLLEENGWCDDVAAKLAAAEHPDLSGDIRRVVVLFVPDPPPLALRALEEISKSLPVDICVHAAPAENNDFDPWGRPLPEKWLRRELALNPSQIEVCDDAVAMAELVSQCIAGLPEKGRSGVTVGVGDRPGARRIADVLKRKGIAVFDPSDCPASRLPMFSFISRLFQLQKDRRYLSFMALARHPDALRRLEVSASAPDELLGDLDEFQNEHIPLNVEDALALAKRCALHVVAALEEVQVWLDKLGSGELLSDGLRSVLKHVYQGVTDPEPSLTDAIQVLHGILEKLVYIEALGVGREDAADLFLRMVSAAGQHPERPAEAIELLGWLELAWEDAPVLLLTDLNDGIIPETLTADPFLPDGARRKAGMRDNAHRLARDAHILESVLNFTGRKNLRGFMPRRSPDGDPLKPSRLLLQCSREDLARRVGRFFSDAGSPFGSLARAPGWRVRLPPLPKVIKPEHVSPSALRQYLDCPFRYYLKKILKLDDPYEEQVELDARGFGTLCHDILKAFADSPLKDSDHEKEVGDFLKSKTDELFQAKFGSRLTLPLMIQRDVVRQRMMAAAEVQARLRREGWEILASEKDFRIDIAGVPLIGRIDRVDRHAKDGRVRVIDYKTTAAAESPEKTHRTKSKNCEPFQICADGNCRWDDLQLPLYIHAWQKMNPGKSDSIEAAYFALPNAVSSTALLVWPGLDGEMVKDAVQCAEKMIRRIGAGVFWPPRPGAGMREDPLERIFFGDIETFLDPESRAELEKRAEDYRAGGGV